MRIRRFTYRLRTSFLCALGLLSAAHAHAALPIGESRLQLKFVDAKTGKALDGVSVVAAESYYWTGFHSSGTKCFRAASGIVDSASGRGAVFLPSVNPVTSTMVVGSTRHIEIVAFRTGYCAAQPFADAHSAGFIKWANKSDPMGLWGKVESHKAGDELVIRMASSDDPSEYRLRYLVRVAQATAGLCFDLGVAHPEAVKSAIIKEAKALATTSVGRILAIRVEEAFEKSGSTRGLWAPVISVAARGDAAELRTLLDWGARDPTFATPYPRSGSPVPRTMDPGPGAVREPFHIDMRDERGMTALMAAAKAMQPATARVLLESGANVNVLTDTGGYSALDLVLSRAADDVKETGTEGQETHLLRMIGLLATAKPAPTLHPAYHEELSKPDLWILAPHRREFWMEVRQRVSPLSARSPVKLTCPNPPAAREALGLSTSPTRSGP